jgi:RNA polymerase sigma factor (sigma-70 family)
MTAKEPGSALRDLRRSLLRRERTGLTDGELLESFISQRDEASFEVLVRRHGPMVLGVCRRVLRAEADAEDAFQATFLVLVRKAASVRPRALVGNWLYGVAQNTALKARAMSQRRRAKEREAAARRSPETPPENGQDLPALLDQELRALPARYRAAIVLCELEGKSLKEAASQFGCPPKTVSTWLVRGRSQLARRLARRGVTLPAGALPAVFGSEAAAAGVPGPLLASTVKTAGLLAAGEALSGVAGAPVAALTEGVIKTMFLAKLKISTALSLVFFVLAGGTAQLVYHSAAAGPQTDPPQQVALPGAKLGPDAPRASEPIVREIHLPTQGPKKTPGRWTFSPDGKKLLYGTFEGGRQGLAVSELATNKTVQVVQIPAGESVETSRRPIWSPKGDRVAYSHGSNDGSSIRVISITRGEPRVLYASSELSVYPSDWSKDGQWLLAIARRKDRTVSLLLLPSEGGAPQQLFSVAWEDEHFSARFSPNGQMIAYHRHKDGQPGYFLFELAARREIAVANDKSHFLKPTPLWTPDGRYLLFFRERGEAWDLCAQRIRDNAPAGEPFVVKPAMAFGKSSDLFVFQMLDDGSLLYVTFDKRTGELFAAPIDPVTGQLQGKPGKPTVLGLRVELDNTNPGPILSPDGQWLAGFRGQGDLYVCKADGTQARKVPTEVQYPFAFDWFPDGKSVLTTGYIKGATPSARFFRIDVTTGQAETLLNQGVNSAGLSSDGQRVAFGMRAEGSTIDLYVMQAKPGAEPVLLRRDRAESFFSPRWSPDDKSLAFVGRIIEDKEPRSRLLLIPAGGGNVKELVGATEGRLDNRGWSPNGKFIAYLRVPGPDPDSPYRPREVWLVGADGGPPVHLRDLDAYDPFSCWWSTDGKSLIFLRFQAVSDRTKAMESIHVWSMTNYLPVE